MRLRHGRLALALLYGSLLLAGGAPTAVANHSASASGTLSLERTSRPCKSSERSYRSRCGGSRVARCAWNVR